VPDAAATVPAGPVRPGPAFSGVVDHLGLSVTDLDRSEDFYSSVLGLLRLADFGHARILVHRPTSFMLALVRHEGADTGPFTELHTGLDHVGFSVGSRDELVQWQHRLEELGVEHTPVRDMEFGHHLNFRDPDHIALELSASNEIALAWLAELRDREIPREEIDARLGDHLASLATT
jgi:glyoxylase I family protein